MKGLFHTASGALPPSPEETERNRLPSRFRDTTSNVKDNIEQISELQYDLPAIYLR